MTREEAKQRLLDTAWLGSNEDRDKTEEAVRVLIKALEQEPQTDGDCISRQAVLDLIDADWKYEGLETYVADLPSVTPQEPSGDLISRQAVLDIDFNRICVTYAKPSEMIRREITALSSVTPQEKTGHWINDEDTIGCYYCSECGGYVASYDDAYCKYCGCRMESEVSE